MADLRKASANRDPIRQKLDAQLNCLDDLVPLNDKELYQCRCVLNDYLKQLAILDTAYLDVLPNTNDQEGQVYTAEEIVCSEYRAKTNSAIGAIEEELASRDRNRQVVATLPSPAGSGNVNSAISNNSNNSKPKMKINPISLPKFSGKETEDYAKFIYNFEQLLDRYDLIPYEKFCYLRDCLTGKALDTISALEEEDSSWQDACDLLEKYFLNTEFNKYKLLESFNSLKCTYTGENIYKFFGKVDRITKAIERSDIDLNFVIQYFLWKSLSYNQTLENIFVNMTHVAYPTLDMINQHRDAAIALYERQQLKFEQRKSNREKFSRDTKSRVKSNQASEMGLAANIPESKNKKDKGTLTWCILCKGQIKITIIEFINAPILLHLNRKLLVCLL